MRRAQQHVREGDCGGGGGGGGGGDDKHDDVVDHDRVIWLPVIMPRIKTCFGWQRIDKAYSASVTRREN